MRTLYLLWLSISIFVAVTGFIKLFKHFKETTTKDRKHYANLLNLHKQTTKQQEKKNTETLVVTETKQITREIIGK